MPVTTDVFSKRPELPALVLVHGLGSAGTIWKTLHPGLEDTFTISDDITISISKALEDSSEFNDNNSFTFNRTEADIAYASDIIEDYTDNTGATGYFLEDYASTTQISFS